jgi:hypothetical protein
MAERNGAVIGRTHVNIFFQYAKFNSHIWGDETSSLEILEAL